VTPPPIDLVITDDVVPFLLSRYPEDVLRARIGSIQDIVSDFLSKAEKYLPQNYRPEVIDVTHLTRQLHEVSQSSHLPIVSLDDINIPWAKYKCHITTLIGEDGHISWVSKSRTDPSDEIAFLRALGPVALIDIGTQTGSLASWCVENLLVGEIYMGICGRRSMGRLERLGVSVKTVRWYQYLQWVELKDLIGLDGRWCVIDGRTIKLSAITTFIENAHISDSSRRMLKQLCISCRANLMNVLKDENVETTPFDDVILSLD
jgi:hypothetical protein